MKNRTYYIVAVLFLVAFVTVFNYVGCGGGGSGSGSSGGTPTETVSTPTQPTGTISGTTGTSYSYSTSGASSSLGHTVEYQFDWKGDGTVLSAWGSASQSKSWSSAGTYSVRAKARCAMHTSVVSGWSSGLSVIISDTTPPTISFVSPSNNSIDILVYGNISVTFSEPMSQTTAEGAFSISPAVAGAFSWSSNTMTLDPTVNLAYSTVYTCTVSTAAQDLAGNNMASPYQWSFTTIALLPPTCTTNPASNIGTTSATLNGTVNPNGTDVTSCYFDYGTSVSYGSQQDVVTLPSRGTSPISVTANVSSLSISTTYNFRVVAINDGGTTNGSNQTFATAAYFRVTGSASMTAGTTNDLTVTAYDAYNNVATGYTGSETLTFSGPVAIGAYTPQVEGVNVGTALSVTFVNGVSTSLSCTLVAYRAEVTTVDVTDGTINSFGNVSYDLDLTVNSAGPLSYTVAGGSVVAYGVDYTTTVSSNADTYGNTNHPATTITMSKINITGNPPVTFYTGSGPIPTPTPTTTYSWPAGATSITIYFIAEGLENNQFQIRATNTEGSIGTSGTWTVQFF